MVPMALLSCCAVWDRRHLVKLMQLAPLIAPAAAILLIALPGGALREEALAQVLPQAPRRPTIILGRKHPGKVSGLVAEGVLVDLRDGGTQLVQFSEIWRIRRAFASDEPQGTTVIDFANNRLFVATPLANLVGELSKKIPVVQLTAPNGETIYLVANKITDIFNSLPGLHNPSSKTVIGTRDGTQQVLEDAGNVNRLVSDAHTVQ
jgi:hypothetical protein